MVPAPGGPLSSTRIVGPMTMIYYPCDASHWIRIPFCQMPSMIVVLQSMNTRLCGNAVQIIICFIFLDFFNVLISKIIFKK
jgi:hypothetical protein